MKRLGALTLAFVASTQLQAVPARAADTVYYYSSDTLHSEVVVTDQNRNVVERTHYAPYGAVLNRDLRDGPGYTGHEEDPETNLVYMQQRYYDPEAGRFLSTDPVQADGGGGSFNRYEYANDNPYRYTDPFGMCTGSHISNSDGTCVSSGDFTTSASNAHLPGASASQRAGILGIRPSASSGRPSKPIGEGRHLVGDEVNAAKTVYDDKVDYDSVRVVKGKYTPIQGANYAVTPNGNIYFPGDCGNLVSCGGGRYEGLFIHEMMHVLQYQSGVNVLGRGLLLQTGKFLSFGLYNPYKYKYDPNRNFSSYNIEQQGDIAVGIFNGIYPNNIDYSGYKP